MATNRRRMPRASAAHKTISRRMPDTYAVSDSYLNLVKQFALTPIRGDDHLAEALYVIDQLLQHNLDEGEQDYLDVLTDLVATYEDKHVSIPDASESDVLRELMRSHKLSQSELHRRTGIAQSTISAVLSGDRSLTKQQVGILAKFFGVSPAAFMPAS